MLTWPVAVGTFDHAVRWCPIVGLTLTPIRVFILAVSANLPSLGAWLGAQRPPLRLTDAEVLTDTIVQYRACRPIGILRIASG